MNRRFVALAFLLALCVPAAGLAASRAPVISKITIRGADIFDTDLDPRLRRFPYTWVNALHIQTKEEVIRRELLFKVGDHVDPFLINETERNLRALSFIRSARVSRIPRKDGTVAIVVHVNDAWTTEPQLNLGGRNGINSTELGFAEKNLLGYGKEVDFAYKKGQDFTRREYSYFDPRIAGTRFQLHAKATDETRGHDRQVSVERPFFSADTRWSVRTTAERNVQDLDVFENDVRVSTFKQTKDIGEIGGAAKIGSGRTVVTHVGPRYRIEITSFTSTAETDPARGVPQNQRLQTIFLDMDTGRNNFVEMTHLEKMTRVEDLNLGPLLKLSPGYSPRVLTGRPGGTQLECSIEARAIVHEENLLFQRLSYTGRETLGRGQNELFEVQEKYYRRASDLHTIVFNGRLDWGQDLDPDNPVKLGGNNGLRSQKDDRFVGTRSLLLNIEDRYYFIDELWNI
ncbi:MAG: hypothetical protein JO102_06140, partial [Elusimicrobia bacterium]|nr:hypothetical protein [Elusimicrobiota bacterium]